MKRPGGWRDAQQLRAHAVLVEDPGLVPTTHIVVHDSSPMIQGSLLTSAGIICIHGIHYTWWTPVHRYIYFKGEKHCSLYSHMGIYREIWFLVSGLSFALLVRLFPFKWIEAGYRKQVPRRKTFWVKENQQKLKDKSAVADENLIVGCQLSLPRKNSSRRGMVEMAFSPPKQTDPFLGNKHCFDALPF